MKNLNLAALVLLVCAAGAFAQPRTPKPKPTPKPQVVSSAARQIVFAVLNNGTSLEPIGYVSKGKFSETVNGSGDKNELKSFAKTYYKAGQAYSLVFGGAKSGTVTVKSSNVNTECAPNTANVRTTGSVHLSKLIMGLGTNMTIKQTSSTRRKPTPSEKSEADAIATAEFLKEKLTAKTLHFQNLTAINVGGTGGDVLVGSYWIDIDGDGIAEIFTYQQGFEGAGFTAFQRSGSHWTKAYEFNNYHCGF
jgi:hypothetical protein